MLRGDIVMIRNEFGKSTGCEQRKDRPAIIVSNNICNQHSPVIEVVYLTTSKRKSPLPTHVNINSTHFPSTALCEAIYSVDKSRVTELNLCCTLAEILEVNRALCISLGLI